MLILDWATLVGGIMEVYEIYLAKIIDGDIYYREVITDTTIAFLYLQRHICLEKGFPKIFVMD